jgi:hypothetical protein
MRSVFIISQILLLAGLSIAQHNPYNTFNIEAELKKFVERGGKAEEVSPNFYKLTYRDGRSRVYNLNKTEYKTDHYGVIDTTIINVWEIDTTKFSDYFTFWQKVQVANSYWAPLPVEDLNMNKRPELFGYTDTPDFPYPPGGPVRIFERDTDGIYRSIFEYDSSTLFVKALGDIHSTGGKEVYIHSKLVNNGVVYRSDTVGSLPTTFDFTFYHKPNQINNMTFGDFDHNNFTDCVFIDAASALHCIIAEFRDSINNFEELFRFSTTDDGDLAGFAINDFDNDGKNEFIIGSGRHGNIYVVENISENTYSLIDQFTFPVLNAYMLTLTNDIDGNGKPEFWIGGQDFVEGITIYQCYEAIADNTYQIVARIELRYSVSFGANYIQAVDIDDDNKQEIVISSGNNIFILKFVGSIGKHNYKLLYAKLGEATQPGAEFYPVAISDLDGDGKKDILLPFRKYIYPITYAFSYILRQDKLTELPIDSLKEMSDNIITSYPTPFNSVCTITFKIRKRTTARLAVYNSLGEEIKILLENELAPDKYKITWDATDKYGKSLPSGIYLFALQTNQMLYATKTIYLK